MAGRGGLAWTRDELILAINLYCKTPFGKIDKRNPQIVDLATKLGRSPSSIGLKLANFAGIDPTLDRKGASHCSKLDRQVWEEFWGDWEEMSYQSELAQAQLNGLSINGYLEIREQHTSYEGQTREALVETRVKQNFFRNMILTTYDNKCCVTGLSVPELLVASHIIPWAQDKANRLNPSNGLCLNALHDKAFDRGLITIDDNFAIVLSPILKDLRSQRNCHPLLFDYSGKKIQPPKRFLPNQEFLEYHRTEIFQRG